MCQAPVHPTTGRVQSRAQSSQFPHCPINQQCSILKRSYIFRASRYNDWRFMRKRILISLGINDLSLLLIHGLPVNFLVRLKDTKSHILVPSLACMMHPILIQSHPQTNHLEFSFASVTGLGLLFSNSDDYVSSVMDRFSRA